MAQEAPPLDRRVWAVLALASLAAALVLALDAVLGSSAWRLVGAIVAVGAASIGLWYALTRRGLLRLVGTSAAVAGSVAFVVLGLVDDHRGIPMIAAVAMGALSGVAVRRALSVDQNPEVSPPSAEARAPRARMPVLIMNPRSGGGKAEKFRLVDECRARGIEPVVLVPGDDLLQLARDAVVRGADVLGMAGGDGSQALVASVASEHGLAYVCVPAGTRNHFALDLGIDRDDVVGALAAFGDGVEHRVDLARVNGRVFVNNASMGVYAKIVQSDSYRDAKVRTALDMLPDLVGPNAKPFDLRFRGPDGAHHASAQLILVSNDPYQLDKLGRGGSSRGTLDAGTLGLVATRVDAASDLARLGAVLGGGRIGDAPGLLEWTGATFRVDSGDSVEVGVDGEALTMASPLVFETLPRALRVRLPPSGRGVGGTPASPRALRTSTVRALLRTAAGRQPAG